MLIYIQFPNIVKVLKSALRRIYSLLVSFGVDPLKAKSTLRGYPKYFENLRLLKRSITSCELNPLPDSVKRFGKPYPIVDQFFSSAGTASGHYFHQDLLVANLVYKHKPDLHLDVGSRIDGFIAHLLSFDQKTILGDVRPIKIENPNISFVQMDLTGELPIELTEKYKSVSCLHAIEHMGLGRYGDPVNACGHYVALKNLTQLLSKTGFLYVSYPLGKESRIEYNAHRVISLEESRNMFEENSLTIRQFSYVDDKGNLVSVDNLKDIDWHSSYGLNYGCAIWTLQKT